MRNSVMPPLGVFTSCLLGAAISSAANAQSVSLTNEAEMVDEIIIRAHPLSAEGLAQPIATLSGEKLQRALAPSLAETLRDIPGVHSSSFGQAVGRPVIRGLGGPRVKVMEDRIDSMDVSVSSPDHMTTIEPFAAESIEVLKGPSTLLYGSGAIGGVVNVHTGRIPHEVPEHVSGAIQIRGADNANQQTTAGRLNAGSGNFAVHVDGFYRDADEYDIPGFAESSALRAQEAAEDGHEHDDDHDGDDEGEEAFGTLPGSQVRAQGGALGASYIGERGFFGVSVSTYDAEYGLPGHSHAHEHGEEDEEHAGEHSADEHGEEEDGEGNPILDLAQTRVDLEGGFDTPFAGVRNINFRLGYNDYEHTEFEGNGESGTVFSTQALEARFELTHEPLWGFEGATGVQVSSREFSALGEEAFVQPVDTQTLGLFYVGQRKFGDLGVETGVRYEHVDHDPTDGASRSFDLAAVSLGLIQPLGDVWTLSGQLDYSSRAPVAEELYSNGPHLATQSFEIGDPTLNEEITANLSANLRYSGDSISFNLSAFVTDFSDFIFEANTGLEMDELPVLQWQQADARFHGFEADASWNALSWDGGSLALNAGIDVVRARLQSGDNRNLPRLPPQRWRLGAIVNWNSFAAEVAWRRVDDQDETAFGELTTEGFDDLRIHFAYTWEMGGRPLELFLSGRNLTDDEQRYHTSFIKDLAPQPGRTIEAGVQISL